jgi:hypothetical protein
MTEKKIEDTRAEIAKKLAEATELEAKAKELTSTDIDASTAADLRANATRRAIERLRTLLALQVDELLRDTEDTWATEDKAANASREAKLDALDASYPAALATARKAIAQALSSHPYVAENFRLTDKEIDLPNLHNYFGRPTTQEAVEAISVKDRREARRYHIRQLGIMEE